MVTDWAGSVAVSESPETATGASWSSCSLAVVWYGVAEPLTAPNPDRS